MQNKYKIPVPIVDKKESDALEQLTEKYNKLIEPSAVNKIAQKAGELIPDNVKRAGAALSDSITEQELYQKALELISSGFQVVEEQVSKYTINADIIVKNVSKQSKDVDITYIDEICLARSYDIAKAVSKNKDMSRLYAAIEGGATGTGGFWGYHLILSLVYCYTLELYKK